MRMGKEDVKMKKQPEAASMRTVNFRFEYPNA